MTQDKSREKSLLFLLSAVSRTLEVSLEDKAKFRESIAALQIQDLGDKWEISSEISNQVRNSVEITKDRFIFYPTKSAARYEINPAVRNKNSAQEVLLSLFAEHGVQVPGKKFQPLQRRIIDFLPFNLIFVSLFTLFSIYKLEPVSFALIVTQMFVSTAKHHISSFRRWLLILVVTISALGFLTFNNSESNSLQVALSQITLFFIFDLTIRIE